MKVDLADGFYRVSLITSDLLKLAVSTPTIVGEDPFIAILLVLPIGSTESPPIFCAGMEKIVDEAKRGIRADWDPPPHRLTNLAQSLPPNDSGTIPSPTSQQVPWARRNELLATYLSLIEIFVDNFIGVAQGTEQHLTKIRATLLHVFVP
mmetsp:Transcript_16306/g.24678  ORF Transcript_16306/g.24678 Transcript_16306/m.24678 type:complete len:150 (-) Transcript_16306:315-764(-)